VFEAMRQTRGVYLFDEFDALGAERSVRNDVGEIRRVLNSFLQFIERDESESVIVAATNFGGMLDKALFRRFDDVIEYHRPTRAMARTLVENRLTGFDLKALNWRKLSGAFGALSHAEIVGACEEAAREAVLAGRSDIDTSSLQRSLGRRTRMSRRRKSGAGGRHDE
jgi:SpoVK/Ycf46/Vps4 family AAA+-type ATPase